jgi:hypothetical protein
MATYVNDLRLKEITTGDESGTWGTSTNTNLELIAEAFSYGTEVITTNADTHTTTIADGATDPGRSLYLKYTGTLDSACTITIGPNTVSKVWIIENGTSGSQNIIISQGSGADITIPAGDTKVVYSDGAGAGAAFFDAFANLKVTDPAQTNITSVGTLTGFTSTGIDDNADATAITIDSSENVSIGSSFASGVATRVLTVDNPSNAAIVVAHNGATALNLYADADEANIGSYLESANMKFFTTPSGGSATERMRIDSSGRVGINRTPAVANTKLEIGGADDTQLIVLEASGYTGGLGIGATGLQFFSNSTVRGKFDQTGEFLVNRTDGFGTGGAAAMFVTGRSDAGMYVTGSNSDGYLLMSFLNGGLNGIGSITNSNNNAVLYNTSSDYRLKENVDYTWDATTRLKQLKPARFNWISDEAHTTVDGFIAHEVSSIVPEAITGAKDATKTSTNCVLNSEGNLQTAGITEAEWVAGKAETPPRFESDTSWTASHTQDVYQAIDQSKLVPLLVKTIQELEARITTLENA